MFEKLPSQVFLLHRFSFFRADFFSFFLAGCKLIETFPIVTQCHLSAICLAASTAPYKTNCPLRLFSTKMFLRSNSGVCRTYKNGEIILELFITKFHSFVSIVVNLFLLETNFPQKTKDFLENFGNDSSQRCPRAHNCT